SKEKKLYIKTPNILIPIKNVLMKQFSFIREFENHDLFIISKEFFLKLGFLREKFINTGFIFAYPGTQEKYEDILERNIEIFTEDNLLSIIPFNIPTTTIGRDFTKREISNYLSNSVRILKKHQNMNFGLSVKLFDYLELIDLYVKIIKEHENIKLLNLVDLFDNTSNFRNILKVIIKIKREFDNNIVIMVSGRILPKHYPMLVYLGVDLIDSSFLLYLSAENFYDTIEHLLPIYKMKYIPCSCVACKSNLKNLSEVKYSSEKIDLLCLHNLINARNYMMKIKQYLSFEDFRAFVEKSTFDDISLISILRTLDQEYFEDIKSETPLAQKNKKINSFGQSSYNRPDFGEFRERVINSFEPEPWTTLIILLPCSAKKPYSLSKSHKLFHRKLRKFHEFPSFQELILTSPLGVIPRQLEDIYPASSYDISVTGDWDETEISITSEMLIKVLEKFNENIPIICHLEGEYSNIAKVANSKLPHRFYYTNTVKKTTTKESLNSLEELVKEHVNDFKPVNYLPAGDFLFKTWIRKFIKNLDYQFGSDSGIKVITDNLKPIKPKPNSQIDLIDLKTGDKLGVFKPVSGQVDLTIKGAARLFKYPYSLDSNIIIFDGQKIQGSNLFRTGILEYNSHLIPRDGVVVIDKEKKKIIGVGRMIVGSNFIKNSMTGKIVEIYEKL
ncbi:MAG: DUF5591 domain-containing protein, partial [Promethearchaeota archaeon]